MIVLTVVIAMVVAIVNAQLWKSLDVYEKSTPKYYMDNFMKKMKSGDYKGLMSTLGVAETDFIKEEDYISYLNDMFEGKPDEIVLFGGNESEGKFSYEIALEGKNGLKLELTKGEDGYVLRQTELLTNETLIEAPEGFTVVAGSKKLGAGDITETIGVKSFDVADDKAIIPKTITYKLDGFLNMPKISIDGLSTSEYEVIENKDKLTVAVHASGEDKKAVEDFAKEVSVVCANFISKDTSIANYRKFVHPKTSYYRSLSEYSSYWYIDHKDPVVKDLICESIYKHSDNTYTAVVSFNYFVEVIDERGHFKREYPTKYSISIANIDGKLKIVNLLSI